jgi:hypothetical protein
MPGEGVGGAKIAVGDEAAWFELKASFGAPSPYAVRPVCLPMLGHIPASGC